MKLELRRNDTEIITLMDQGGLYPPTGEEYALAMRLIANAIEFASNTYDLMPSLLYVTLNGQDVPSTIDTPEELEHWYLMEFGL